MVEKFNFYDIYGYLLPGVVLLFLLWVPFGVVLGKWPQPEISSALLMLVLAYVVGHFIQTFAVPLLPSKKPDKDGNARYPSDIMLDTTDTKFGLDLKKRISDLAGKVLGLELKFPEDLRLRQANLKIAAKEKALNKKDAELGDKERQLQKENDLTKKAILQKEIAEIKESQGKIEKEISEAKAEGEAIKVLAGQRRDAFFQARSALLKEKGTWYWEQFEGLYALMRGLCFSLGVAVWYLFGWSLVLGVREWFGTTRESWLPLHWIEGAAAVCLLAIFIFSYPRSSGPPPSELPKKTRNFLLAALAFVFLTMGVIAASTTKQGNETKKPSDASFITIVACPPEGNTHSESESLPIKAPAGWIGFLALIAAVASARCYGAYKTFADSFAENVWRDFANIEAKWTKAEAP